MDLSKELLKDYEIDKNTNFIEDFYKNNNKFNFNEYKYFNKDLNEAINNCKNIELIINYFTNGIKNKLISSIEEFYNIYPDFDLIFYKLIYSELIFDNDIGYLSHYHNIGKNENRLYSFNNFKNKYNIDFIFIKFFYKKFNDKNDIEIIKYILNNNDTYILCDEIFCEKYPKFNIKIYKLFNDNIYFINDTLYKSHWYHIGKYENLICSIIELSNNNIFNYKLYKYLYNIDRDLTDDDIIYWYNNKDKLIYSNETLFKYLDDFNYIFFMKHYPNIKDESKIKIIDFFVLNIEKINTIYSEKFFYLKYSYFNLNEYKIFNKTNSNNIFNEYHNKLNKMNIIISINDFYKKIINFNLEYYKNIINIKNNIVLNNENEYIYYWYHYDRNNYYLNENFYELYPTFNLSIYKYFNKNIVKNLDNMTILFDFKFKNRIKDDIIYSINTFYKHFHIFDKDIYKLFNNLNNYEDDDLVIHFHSIGLPLKLICNEKMIEDINFNKKIYKELNKDLKNLSDKELIIHWYKVGKYQDRIYSIKTFYKKYNNINFIENNNQYIINEEDKIIYWMNIGVYKYLKSKNENIIGRNIVTNIYEVLIDLSNPYSKEKLQKGISLIIRAKNEELNIKYCIESVIDLVDEIIFVDNNSIDNTYNIVKSYSEKYDKIKLYQYNINVSKVGIEHQNALNSNDKNTLGTFYNWCLSKATRYNVFKWDADFICIRNNFIKLIEKYNLINRDDKFSIWFTGKTLFENNSKYYLNFNSFYDEFRIFSYKNNFSWSDGNTCEYTDPYLNSVHFSKKYKFKHPLFYELKRTSVDEFKERSSLIDNRDIKDFYILNNLKDNNEIGLIEINNSLLNSTKTIILYTPSLSFGGGNQFIINIYNIYKSIGLTVFIVPMKNEIIGNNKYNSILEEDIIDIKYFDIEFIKKNNPEFILFNSDILFKLNDIILISNITKIFFVTHSDIAFANSFIENYHYYFNKIITVNNYTISKLSDKLNINKLKFLKLINYSDNQNIIENKVINKKFGIVSRFSEDKNIPMLIYSLKEIFSIYNDYKFYFVGTNNLYYDDYLINLCKINNIEKNIYFEGYQEDVNKYYSIFDFIILPSVSEGCSYNIIEAMNFGLPIVTSDVGGNHELIKNNENGILYSYTGIKTLEEKTIFVKNYNLHLFQIGYFINDDQFKNNYMITNNYEQIDAIVPFFVKCRNHNSTNLECTYCNNVINKISIFNKNLKNIKDSLKKMIEYNQNNLNEIKINNIDFIKKNFNYNDYTKQILKLIDN